MQDIRLFVSLDDQNENFKSEVNTNDVKQIRTRQEFVSYFGYAVKVHGSIFTVNQIKAEPKKKHVWLEIALAFSLVAYLLFLFPDVMSPSVHAMCLILSVAFGVGIGNIRISRQHAIANNFNNSTVDVSASEPVKKAELMV